MKYPLFALLVLHGLIHLLGFVKAFGLGQPAQLQAAISRPAGLAWLAAALLLAGGGGLLLLGWRGWWAPAALGVLLSQALIFSAWSDARAGSLANLVLLLPIALAALQDAPWGFRAQYAREAAARFGQPPAQTRLLAEADAAHLPPIVQRYLAFAGVFGKPAVWNYRLRFAGGLRNGPGDPWMRISASQQSFVDPPARLVLIESSKFGLPFGAFHRYVGPQATFKVRLAGLFTVVDAAGPHMDQSETVTLLNDMFLLAPATLVDPTIRWEELDPLTVRASWTNAGHAVSAVVSFDSSGALVNFYSDDRSRTVDGRTYERLRWSTPILEWGEYGGRRLPAVAEATWDLPAGPFAYARYELVEIQYNLLQAP